MAWVPGTSRAWQRAARAPGPNPAVCAGWSIEGGTSPRSAAGSTAATTRSFRIASVPSQASSKPSSSPASQGTKPGPSGRPPTRASSAISTGSAVRAVAVTRTESIRLESPSAASGTAAASKASDSRLLTIHQCAIGTPSRSNHTGEARIGPGSSGSRHSRALSPVETTLPGPTWNARCAPGNPSAAIE